MIGELQARPVLFDEFLRPGPLHGLVGHATINIDDHFAIQYEIYASLFAGDFVITFLLYLNSVI